MLKKILILIALLVILALAIFAFRGLSTKNVSDVVVVPVTTATTTDSVVIPRDIVKGGDTTIGDLITPLDVSTTTYKLYGKYSTYQIVDEESVTHTCTAFTISTGDEKIVSKYKTMVKEGNTINRIDGNGRLVLNINLMELPQSQQNTLINSTSDVSLMIRDKELPGKDGRYCISFVKLVSVEK